MQSLSSLRRHSFCAKEPRKIFQFVSDERYPSFIRRQQAPVGNVYQQAKLREKLVPGFINAEHITLEMAMPYEVFIA